MKKVTDHVMIEIYKLYKNKKIRDFPSKREKRDSNCKQFFSKKKRIKMMNCKFCCCLLLHLCCDRCDNIN